MGLALKGSIGVNFFFVAFSLEQFTRKHISVYKKLFFLHIHLLWVHPGLKGHKLSLTTVSGTSGVLQVRINILAKVQRRIRPYQNNLTTECLDGILLRWQSLKWTFVRLLKLARNVMGCNNWAFYAKIVSRLVYSQKSSIVDMPSGSKKSLIFEDSSNLLFL